MLRHTVQTIITILGLFGSFLGILAFDNDFKNQRLAFRDEIPLAAWQLGEQRQFEPLQDRLNAPQMMTATRTAGWRFSGRMRVWCRPVL